MTAAELRRLLTRLGLSQGRAARLLGTSQQAVSLWCRGRRPVPGPVAWAVRCWADHGVPWSGADLDPIRAALPALPARDAQVLRLAYGLDDGRPRTLAEIGRMMGLSRERVRQLRDRALKRAIRAIPTPTE